jgi:hypothetical protein
VIIAGIDNIENYKTMWIVGKRTWSIEKDIAGQ